MSKKETFSNILGETRGGRLPPKSKIWGDVFYGWSLTGQELFFTVFYSKLALVDKSKCVVSK